MDKVNEALEPCHLHSHMAMVEVEGMGPERTTWNSSPSSQLRHVFHPGPRVRSRVRRARVESDVVKTTSARAVRSSRAE